MMLGKKWMSGLVALGVLLGTTESYAVLNAYQANLKKQLESRRLGLADEDILVLGVMVPSFLKPLVDKWKEAQAAGMSNALIRATIGTNKNQAAIDALTAEIAQRKGTTASTVSAPLALPDNSAATASSSSSSNSSSSSSIATFTAKDVDDAFQKILKLQMDGSLKKDFAAYVMSVAKTRDAMEKLLKEMKSYYDDPVLKLTPEQYVDLMKMKISMADYRELRGYGYFYHQIYSSVLNETFNKLLAEGRSSKAGKGTLNMGASSSSSSSASLTSGKQNPSIIGELTEEKIREAIGLPNINLGILTAYVADFKRMLKVEMITQKTVAEILGKIRTELDDARAAGFTDEQLNDLLNRGLIYSNWRTYIKLPGKTPAKFSQVMMNRDRASAFAFFGLDEEKATISEGKQAISAYPTQKGYASLPNNRYWEEKIVFWSNLRSRDLGAN